MRVLLRRACYSPTILLLVTGLSAQTPDTATIQGRVKDSNRAPINGVSVVARNLLTGAKRTVQTDEAGYFAIPGLVAGTNYSVQVTKDGFDPFVASWLSPAAGAATDTSGTERNRNTFAGDGHRGCG